MPLNFPSSPTTNTTYTFNTKTWTYNGNAWALSTGGSLNTSVVPEGSNLYFSNARVYSNVSQLGYATTSYVSNQLANLVASAPATLDTLNELAAALGNDNNFSTTVITQLGTKANIADLTAANITGTTLNSSIVTSSLTSVGTLGSLTVTGNVNSGAISTTGNSTAANYQSTGNVNTGNLRVTTNSTLGTVVSGTWNGASVSTNYTDAKVTSVNGQTGAAIGFATTANSLSQFATTSSAQLATLISDETGSGNLVFSTSPTFVTPVLGTPTSGNFSTGTFTWPTFNQNTSGTAAGLSATLVVGSGGTGNTVGYASGGAASAATKTVSDDTTTAATYYPTFVTATSGNVASKVASTKLTFAPNTGLLTSTDYNSSSDERLKKNIKTVENALEKITALRGVTFNWKDNDTKGVGLIAQEVEDILPEVVTTDENGFMGIKYTNIIGILVEAIKDQQEQINTLKKQIEKL